MPIVDVAVVHPDDMPPPPDLARALADGLGGALQVPAGRLWVRVHSLPSARYAENGHRLAADALPVFVTVLHAAPPAGAALGAEIATLTDTVAHLTGRPRGLVHLEYAPAGRGRLAFGGRLVE